MDTSPMFTMATSRPASSFWRTSAAAACWAAARLAGSGDIEKSSGRISLPARSTACRVMSRATILPPAVRGAATTGHAPMTRAAFKVSSSGSPGPTPTA